MCGKMINVLLFHEILKDLIVKFFSSIGLQVLRFISICRFEDLSKRLSDIFACLLFNRLSPCVFGKLVNDHQNVSESLILFGNRLHFHQISHHC